MWYYKTKFGVFKIIQNKTGLFDLLINDEALGSYPSPESAADDVYTQTTGFYEWDSIDPPVNEPTDLSEWIH